MDFLLFKISEVDKIRQKILMKVQSMKEKLLFDLIVTHLLRNLGYEVQLRDYVY